MAYIYKITNTLNQKSYIGKTEKPDPLSRWKEHLRDSNKEFKNKRPLYAAIKKYGKDNFTFEVIEETSQPIEREMYYISLYNTYKEGYNATIGGDGKPHVTNQSEIVTYYLEHKPFIKDLCDHFQRDRKTITKILKDHNIIYDVKARHTKTIIQKDKDGNTVNTFNSAREAAISIGNIKLNSHINQCCNGKRKSIAGYIWEFQQ